MTVGELIAQLQELDPTLPVYVPCQEEWGYEIAESIKSVTLKESGIGYWSYIVDDSEKAPDKKKPFPACIINPEEIDDDCI